MKKHLVKVIPVLIVVALIGIFIYNIVSHGVIEHPGKSVYKAQCAQCHSENGEGIKALVPPLNTDFTRQNFDSIPCWLKHGLNRPITINGKVFDQAMYPLPVDEIQTANVLNYISSEFLKTDRQVNSAWVKAKLKECK